MAKGTTFVSVVDPGVGSSRKSVVALTKTGQYIVTPDNGTLSYIKKDVGIVAVREISKLRIVVVIRSCLIPSMVVMFMPIQVPN
ncbi:MAG: SAM-dependent chlorinase/fluorinase [Streptococcus salivarius]